MSAADSPPDLRKTLESLTPPGSDHALNIFRTMAHHPKLLRAYLPFGSRLLLGGELPDRDRELVILVTAHLCGCSYEWDHHAHMAKAAGLSDGEIERVRLGPRNDRWPPEDAVLVAATGELVSHHALADHTWSLLAARYSQRQLLELTMLVGHYAMLAGMLNSAGVERDPPGADAPDRKG
jgi:4-carboxymuconolactone decarboxylase